MKKAKNPKQAASKKKLAMKLRSAIKKASALDPAHAAADTEDAYTQAIRLYPAYPAVKAALHA